MILGTYYQRLNWMASSSNGAFSARRTGKSAKHLVLQVHPYVGYTEVPPTATGDNPTGGAPQSLAVEFVRICRSGLTDPHPLPGQDHHRGHGRVRRVGDSIIRFREQAARKGRARERPGVRRKGTRVRQPRRVLVQAAPAAHDSQLHARVGGENSTSSWILTGLLRPSSVLRPRTRGTTSSPRSHGIRDVRSREHPVCGSPNTWAE